MKKLIIIGVLLLSAALVAQTRLPEAYIDNLLLDGNTVSSTNTNGDVNISPNGTGTVVINTDLDVDNINVNGNTVSSTDTDGNINLSPNGTGSVVVNTDLDVDNLNFNGNTISNTSTGGIIIDPAGSQDFVLNDLTASRVLVLDTSKAVQSSVITSTELGYLDDVTSALCGINQTCTLTNKTLTSPVLNTGVSGTAILDEDTMISNSATQLATQQSIKAYVDANAGGGGSSAYRAVTTTDNVGTSDETMKLSGASFTSTLPTAVGVEGKRYKFIHAGTSFSQVYTLATTSSQTIGGVAGGSYALHTNGEALSIESDGANWIIVNHVTDTMPTLWTPIYAGLGTVSTSNMYWSRRGSYLKFQGSFVTGTPSGATASMTLPGGTIDVTFAGSKLVGTRTRSASSTNDHGGFMITSTTTGADKLYFGSSNTFGSGTLNPMSLAAGSGNFGSSETQFLHGEVHMAGWQP